jgi:hypothetical protein
MQDLSGNANQELRKLFSLLDGFSVEQRNATYSKVYKTLLGFSVLGLAWVLQLVSRGSGVVRPYGAWLVAALHVLSVLFLSTMLSYRLDQLLVKKAGLKYGFLTPLTIFGFYYPYIWLALRRWTGLSNAAVTRRLLALIGLTWVIDALVGSAAFAGTILLLRRGW